MGKFSTRRYRLLKLLQGLLVSQPQRPPGLSFQASVRTSGSEGPSSPGAHGGARKAIKPESSRQQNGEERSELNLDSDSQRFVLLMTIGISAHPPDLKISKLRTRQHCEFPSGDCSNAMPLLNPRMLHIWGSKGAGIKELQGQCFCNSELRASILCMTASAKPLWIQMSAAVRFRSSSVLDREACAGRCLAMSSTG